MTPQLTMSGCLGEIHFLGLGRRLLVLELASRLGSFAQLELHLESGEGPEGVARSYAVVLQDDALVMRGAEQTDGLRDMLFQEVEQVLVEDHHDATVIAFSPLVVVLPIPLRQLVPADREDEQCALQRAFAPGEPGANVLVEEDFQKRLFANPRLLDHIAVNAMGQLLVQPDAEALGELGGEHCAEQLAAGLDVPLEEILGLSLGAKASPSDPDRIHRHSSIPSLSIIRVFLF